MQANRTRFSSGALQWEVSIALYRRRGRFAFANAGERRDAGRKTDGIRRIPANLSPSRSKGAIAFEITQRVGTRFFGSLQQRIRPRLTDSSDDRKAL